MHEHSSDNNDMLMNPISVHHIPGSYDALLVCNKASASDLLSPPIFILSEAIIDLSSYEARK